MQRLRISMKGLYSANFVAYDFANLTWNYFLYDYTLDATNTPYTQSITVGTTTSTSKAKIGSIEFIYPLPIKYNTVIDGVVRGFVKVKFKTNNASYKAYVDEIEIAIKSLDTTGTEIEIGKHTVSTSLETTSTSGDIKSIPFWFDVLNQELSHDERIVVEITLYGQVVSGGTGTYYLDCEINKEDLLVILPIV